MYTSRTREHKETPKKSLLGTCKQSFCLKSWENVEGLTAKVKMQLQVTSAFKSSLYAISLLRKTYVSTFFSLTERNMKRNFASRKNCEKRAFSVWFAENRYRGSAHSVERDQHGHTLSQELQSVSERQTSIALSSIFKNLSFITIYFVHMFTR